MTNLAAKHEPTHPLAARPKPTSAIVELGNATSFRNFVTSVGNAPDTDKFEYTNRRKFVNSLARNFCIFPICGLVACQNAQFTTFLSPNSSMQSPASGAESDTLTGTASGGRAVQNAMVRVGTDETFDCNPKRKRGNALRPSLTLRVTTFPSACSIIRPRWTQEPVCHRDNAQFYCALFLHPPDRPDRSGRD